VRSRQVLKRYAPGVAGNSVVGYCCRSSLRRRHLPVRPRRLPVLTNADVTVHDVLPGA